MKFGNHFSYFSCIGILRYGLQPRNSVDISTLELPFLFNETSLMLFTFMDRYQTLLKNERMPPGHNGRADVEIILNATQEYTADGLGIRWMVNGAAFDMTSLQNLTTPLLIDLYNGNEQNLPRNVVYTLEQNQLVDIVIQNTVALNGVCESHPIHIHGHKFWVHSYGVGLYVAKTNIWPDKDDPVLRDTLMVYASSYAYFTVNRTTQNHGKPCGWTKFRMIADNPGLWLLHCHIGAHSYMGMNVLLKEGIDHLSMIYLNQN
jgi:FtsP/CotA-like multicopper oxidase with cupredoxin domain